MKRLPAYRRALEIKPDLTEAYNNLGITLNALGHFDGAVESYGRALAINAVTPKRTAI